MHPIILFIHLFVAFIIIALVLVQQGRGADTGASFGSGGSQTVFGSAGSGNFLSHTTSILAAIFFTTSFTLALLTKQELGSSAPTFSAPEQQAPSAPPAAGKTGAQDVPAGVVPVPGGNNEAPNAAPKTDTQGAPAGVVPVPGGNTNQKPKTDADVPVKQ